MSGPGYCGSVGPYEKWTACVLAPHHADRRHLGLDGEVWSHEGAWPVPDIDASKLPEGSIVAGGRWVLVKRTNAASSSPPSPDYKEWWIEASIHAMRIDNAWITDELRVGRLTVLRRGWGDQ